MEAETKLATGATRDSVAVVVLLANTCLMNFGFAMLVPLLAIHFTGSLGFTAASIGLVLALRQFSQQGLDLVGGVFADHFGARTSIVIGCFVRAAGFAGIGTARSLAPLILFAVVSGVGGAFFDASGTAALADVVAPEQRQRVFAASSVLSNVGQAVGPLVGIALLGLSFQLVSLAAAGCFIVIGVLTLTLLPPTLLLTTPPAMVAGNMPGAGRRSVRPTLRALRHDRAFIWLTALLAGYWFLWAQINITVPLVAIQIAGRTRGPQLAALAFAINAAPAILLQYPAVRLFGPRYPAGLLLAISTGLCGMGMALVFATPLVPLFLAGVAFFALARMLIGPLSNVVTAELAPSGMLGAYFGFGALSVAIGAGSGQYAGGSLFDFATSHHAPLALWGTMLAVGLVVALGLWRLRLPEREKGQMGLSSAQ
ncbi:MAG TPA: MFS transporter [Ktedonobacterales bacterium]|nr:MFS transporter [Ktedonobacterales bacterium]